MKLTTILPLAFAIVSGVSAQASTDEILKITGCAAPTDFTKCMASSVSKEQDCTKGASSTTDKDACGCVGSVERINCFGSACWNKIYSCEYQATVALYFTCPLATFDDEIPFWPSPTNAPGGCSCNTGQVTKALVASSNHTIECAQDVASGGLSNILDKTKACGCCAASVAFSAFANICPETSPTLIGLSNYTDTITSGFSWDTCSSSLSKNDCVKDLGFEAPANGTLYNPSNLPKTGTKTLSNIAGEVTSPVSATYTWSAAGSNWTVTAVSSGAAGSGTGTVAGATATSTPNAAATHVAGGVFGGALVVALGVML